MLVSHGKGILVSISRSHGGSLTSPGAKVVTDIIKDLRSDYPQLSGRTLNAIIGVLMREKNRQITQIQRVPCDHGGAELVGVNDITSQETLVATGTTRGKSVL